MEMSRTERSSPGTRTHAQKRQGLPDGNRIIHACSLDVFANGRHKWYQSQVLSIPIGPVCL
jgi:hypothetical protein